VKYHQILIILIFCSIFMKSCDSNNSSEECIGINFSEIECIGEFLSTASRGFGCDQCTSDIRGEEFGIEFGPLLVPPEQSPVGIGTQFTVDGIEGAFIPEFESCSMIDLFDFTLNQMGEAVKGNMVGSLDDIETILPDMLSFTINIDGLNAEDTFCGFCWAPIRPPCADN